MKPNKEKIIKAARAELIRRGNVDWLFHRGQRELAEFFEKGSARITVFNCARRFGKSYFLVALATKYALAKPNQQIRIAAPTHKQMSSIFKPLVNQIFKHFPKDCMPEHANGTYTFPNGSQIIIAGADYKEGDALRGVASDLILVDEAGFTKNLSYLVQDILLPQTLTTGGRIIIASTPPTSMDHDFISYISRAVQNEAYLKRTIYDNPMLSEKDVEDVVKECGGKETDTFRREYLCELISDTSALIVPEFRADLHIKESPVPSHFKAYVGADFGLKDHTAILFGYLDFVRQVLVIQDEFVANYQTTEQIGNAIKEKEAQLWGEGKEVERIGDNELQILWDLNRIHGIQVRPAIKDYKKHGKDVAISGLRMHFQNGSIEIHPRCKNLIHQLLNGTWDEKRKQFERSEKLGHCDAIDALLYLDRFVKRKENPFPAPVYSPQTHFIPTKRPTDHTEWAKIFKFKRKMS